MEFAHFMCDSLIFSRELFSFSGTGSDSPAHGAGGGGAHPD